MVSSRGLPEPSERPGSQGSRIPPHPPRLRPKERSTDLHFPLSSRSFPGPRGSRALSTRQAPGAAALLSLLCQCPCSRRSLSPLAPPSPPPSPRGQSSAEKRISRSLRGESPPPLRGDAGVYSPPHLRMERKEKRPGERER